MPFSIEKLVPTLNYGVRVSGLTAADIQDEVVRKQLSKLWIQDGLIVFSDTAVTTDFQIELSRCFGELEHHPVREIWVDGYPELVSVRYAPGEEVLYEIDDVPRGAWIPWHMDLVYCDRINHGGILRAVKLPSTGGRTGFIDRIDTYGRLPAPVKVRIEHLYAGYKMNIDVTRNRYATRSRLKLLQKSRFIESMQEREDRDFPAVMHPLVYKQPETGRKVLNLSPLFLTHIIGLDASESDALANELIDHLTDKEHAYYHAWEPTDLVLWDNWRMIHSVTGSPVDETREMQRTTITGDYALGRRLSEFHGTDARPLQ